MLSFQREVLYIYIYIYIYIYRERERERERDILQIIAVKCHTSPVLVADSPTSASDAPAMEIAEEALSIATACDALFAVEPAAVPTCTSAVAFSVAVAAACVSLETSVFFSELEVCSVSTVLVQLFELWWSLSSFVLLLAGFLATQTVRFRSIIEAIRFK